MSELDVVVAEIVDEMRRRLDRGEVATYIPELAAVDPKQFGLAVITAHGHVAAGGDSDTPFSIQSISKVFTLTLALGKVGDRLWRRVGREPSGSPFNSVVQLEYEHGIPRNPFINAGAIAVTDIILSGHQPREVLGEILRFVRFTADDTAIVIDEAVAASEKRTGFRNAALANYMKSFGVLDNPVDYTLGVYFPSLRHRDVVPTAGDGRTVSRPSRPQSHHRLRRSPSRTRAAHQCGDAGVVHQRSLPFWAAADRTRSTLPPAKVYSSRRFPPSIQPRAASPFRNAANRDCVSGSSSAISTNTATRRTRSPCCARAVIRRGTRDAARQFP